MKNVVVFLLFFVSSHITFAQSGAFDFAKSENLDKTKTIGVRKERKDKYGYNSLIERWLLKTGYSVGSDFTSFYAVEYLVGPQPVRRGADDFTFRIKVYEVTSGKLIASASIVSRSKNEILDNLDRYVSEFFNKAAN
ncbi:MAG TPA: hypothetical protein PLY25_08685 [Bacteroidia bacterium]|nr:hypothetical protein [Bacteroidia bacterium]